MCFDISDALSHQFFSRHLSLLFCCVGEGSRGEDLAVSGDGAQFAECLPPRQHERACNVELLFHAPTVTRGVRP